MTAGTLLVGLSGYVFLALVGHNRFPPATAAALSSMYLLMNILGPGLFVAVEQETSRLVSQRSAAGVPFAAATRRTAIAAAVITAVTLLVVLGFSGLARESFLRGEAGLLIAIAISVVGSAAVFWIRGVNGGRLKFRRYGVTLLVDAGVRIVGCLGLAVAGVTTPLAFGLAVCLGPLVAACVTGPGTVVPDQGRPETPPAWPGLSAAVGALLVSSGIAMAIANLSPVLVNAALPTDPALAFGFAGALVLTRVPLLLMGPVQAVVLPRLVSAVTLHRMHDFRTQLGRAMLLVAGLVSAAVVGVLLVGRWAIRVVFGAAADLVAAPTLALLALAAGSLMAIALLQPALVALGRHRGMVWGWVLGGLVFGGSLLLPSSVLGPLDRALLAQLAGPFVTLLVQLWIAWSASRDGSVISSREIGDRPL